jgi:AcrR family transcriptional regulator
MAAGELAERPSLGQYRLPRDPVVEIQRSRLIVAALELVGETGYDRLAVGEVITGSRVSRKTFYVVFVDREDCFLAAIEGCGGAGIEAIVCGSLARLNLLSKS